MDGWLKSIYEWTKKSKINATVATAAVGLVLVFAAAYLPVTMSAKLAESLNAVLSCGQIECPVSDTTVVSPTAL